jgi:hypothetical protein
VEQQRIDPATPLSVTMKAVEWEAMLQVLQKAPYEQVAGAIQAIVAQCTSASRTV